MSALEDFDDPKLEALVETMFLAAYADGEFSDEEREYFKKSVQTLTNGKVSADDLDAMVTRFEKEIEGENALERLKSVKERLPDAGARKVALSLAIQMTAADGIIRTSERELIMDVADGLEIDRGEAADMVKELEP